MVTKFFLMLLVTLLLLGLSHPGKAQLPVDPSIVHGNAIINTVGNHMMVTNSPNTILNWQSFSIGVNESVYFQQQDITSQVLNRVTSNDPSQIFGSLSSNGSIWLINPHGVLFGSDAQIDVAGLVASTLDISNIDFLAKRYHFNSKDVSGEVKNQGEIRTSLGGRVWLMGDRAQNEGLIQAPSGQIVLAAGKSIDLIDSGAPNVVVRVRAPENEVVNLGSLVASSGNVDLHGSIVNQAGFIRANSVSTDAAGRIVLIADQVKLAANSQTQANKGVVQLEASATLKNLGDISGNSVMLTANEIMQQGQVTAQGGNVALIASASTYLDGLIDVSNSQGTGGTIKLITDKLTGMAGGVMHADGEKGGRIQVESRGLVALSSTLTAIGGKQGGEIEVTGDQVNLLNANLDASGGMQGGTVHLGGGWQGGGDLAHARTVLIDLESEIKANGDTNANDKGGEIVVWSTQVSENNGLLQAIGGGRIEFSSEGEILRTGDLQAGAGGTILFDPKNLIIDAARALTTGGIKVDAGTFANDASGTSYISPDVIVKELNDGTDVVLQANNDIIVNSPLVAANPTVGDKPNLSNLTLQAGRNVIVNESISFFDGKGGYSKGNITIIAGDAHANPAYRDLGIPTLSINSDITPSVGGLTLAAVNGIIDFHGRLLDVPGISGQTMAYVADPDTTTFPGAHKHYNQPFTGATPGYATSGDWIFYSIAPILSVTPQSDQTIAYGDTFSGSVSNISGFIDGDTIDTVGAVGGSGVITTNGPIASSGYLTAGVHDLVYSNGFTSDLGYQFKDDASSSNELVVNPARLTYLADAATRLVGQPLTDLRGQVVGLVGGDTLADATTGGLVWTTPAATTGPVGIYPIHGGGLAAKNYEFVQAATNERALTLQNLAFNLPFRQSSVDTGVQGTNAGTTGARSVPDRIISARVIDHVTATEFSTANSFGRLNLSKMSRRGMQQLSDYRKQFKEKLFADAIYKLEQDPRLSDVLLCPSLPDIDLGLCRISRTQREEHKSQKEEEQKLKHRSKYKVQSASIPQIEYKIAVIFGTDLYADKTIPSLENAVSDAEAVGQLFENELGYNVRVVKNASRADMVRTLNQLSEEMGVNDSVLIYYAGHGYMNEKTGNGYWIPSDASAKEPASWISNTSISEMLAGINSKQIIMISDSCYSGIFTKEQKMELSSTDVKPEEILAKRSVVAMSSGGDEPVADEGREGHSIFAWFLMQALHGVDKWKTSLSIFEQVRRDVSEVYPQQAHIGAVPSAGHVHGDYLLEQRQLEGLR